MIKKTFLSLVLLAVSNCIFSQALTEKDIQEIKASFNQDAPTKAIMNIVTTSENIRDLALNHELQGKTDHFFKYRVNVSGITNQQSSGRCWMFTSFNVLRPEVMKKYNLSSFDFSQNYLYFWDIFEKSNLFLSNIIRTVSKSMDDREVVELFKSPVNDGGVWNLFYNVASKYGMVPQQIMPETAHSNNTSQVTSIINEKLRNDAYNIRMASQNGEKDKQLQVMRKESLKSIYRILSLCLGNPPTEFTWRYKTKNGKTEEIKTTPMEFYKANVPSDYTPDNYIMIMNDPTREYYKVYDIANYRNTYEGLNWRYLNLPNEDIKKAALASLKAGEAMYASCDVAKYFNRKTGISDPAMYDYESLLGVKIDMDKKARILTRQSGSSHAMAIIACDTDDNDIPTKWEFENSWGPTAGHNGYITFTDKWFDEYLFRVVIRKTYLDSKAVNALNSKPIELPMWDYMF